MVKMCYKIAKLKLCISCTVMSINVNPELCISLTVIRICMNPELSPVFPLLS